MTVQLLMLLLYLLIALLNLWTYFSGPAGGLLPLELVDLVR